MIVARYFITFIVIVRLLFKVVHPTTNFILFHVAA